MNVEPAAANATLLAATTDNLDGYRIVVELTERALVDPPQLLQLVAGIRSLGWGIALDDVGANCDSLALLPLLCPNARPSLSAAR